MASLQKRDALLPLEDGYTSSRSTHDQRMWSRRVVRLGAFALLLWFLHTCAGRYMESATPIFKYPGYQQSEARDPFSWDTTQTLKELEYRPCYDIFQCARLELPMDYWNGTTNKTISLAVIKLPATVPVNDPRYRGPVVTNPGGPGGSGVASVRYGGPTFQSIVSGTFPQNEGPNFYDMLSFDPRGVGATLPSIDCSGTFNQYQPWLMRMLDQGTLTSSDAAFGRLWSMSTALSGRCSEVDDDSIQRHLSTPYVARDMLELIEADARWRQRQLHKLSSPIVVEPKSAKLQYWGFSYGSFLGYSYAALFPDRVSRVVVDGVVAAADYVGGHWLTNLKDTEKTLQIFYNNCARVGYPTCPLAEKTNPNATAVKHRVERILETIWHNPIPISDPHADVVSWSDAKNVLFGSLYSPIAAFPFVAQIFAEIEEGSADTLSKIMGPFHTIPECGAQSNILNHPFFKTPQPSKNGAGGPEHNDPFTGAAIACTDAPSRLNITKGVFKEYVDDLLDLSPTVGEVWGTIIMPCSTYTVRPVHRYAGPFGGNTSHPLLFVGNTADPVTPLFSCHEIAKGYKGARCLTQNSGGHCSTAVYSKCTVNYIAQYFKDGSLPDEGTVCEADILPFGPGSNATAQSTEDFIAAELHGVLGQAILAAGGGFGNAAAMSKVDFGHMMAVQMMQTAF